MSLWRIASIAGLLASISAGSSAQSVDSDLRRTHDVLASALAKVATRGIVLPGDTSVTWYAGNPSYFNISQRIPNGVQSGFVGGRGMTGTALAHWAAGRQTDVMVRWTDTSTTTIAMTVRETTMLVASGSRVDTLALPSTPWVIADYGVDDQSIPLYLSLSGTTRVAVYRPYVRKWDTVTVAVGKKDGVLTVEETDAKGETFTMSLTDDGAILRIVRSKSPTSVRRPLELSRLWRAYLDLTSPH